MKFSKLRLSLTQVCNYRCIYCDPVAHFPNQKESHLPIEQLILLLEILANLGIDELKLTGGEPLLAPITAKLLENDGFKALKVSKSITTNGQLLHTYLKRLREAKINNINVSVDTLNPELYEKMTGFKLQPVLDNIERALDMGFSLKINAVPMKSFQPEMLPNLIEYFAQRQMDVRFIELMQMGHWHQDRETWNNSLITQAELLEIFADYNPKPAKRKPHATAIMYSSSIGNFGIIANTSTPFCNDCNRLRMDVKGYVSGCLSKPLSHNIGQHLKGNISEQTNAIKEMLQHVWFDKEVKFLGQAIPMRMIGG